MEQVQRDSALGERFEQLLTAARAGGEWAWREIYVTLAPTVLGYLRGRGRREAADSNQSGDSPEVFAAGFEINHSAWRHGDHYGHPGRPAASLQRLRPGFRRDQREQRSRHGKL